MMNSRKFRAMAVDAIFAVLALVVTNFVAPDQTELVLKLLGYLQPVVLAYILGVAAEDAAALKAGTHPNQDK